MKKLDTFQCIVNFIPNRMLPFPIIINFNILETERCLTFQNCMFLLNSVIGLLFYHFRKINLILQSPVNSTHKGQWRGALILPLICVWTNAWVNNRDAGDLWRYRVHYDVTIMQCVSRVLPVVFQCVSNVQITIWLPPGVKKTWELVLDIIVLFIYSCMF